MSAHVSRRAVPWDLVLQVSVKKALLKHAHVYQLCTIVRPEGKRDFARCGWCNRGRFKTAQRGRRCRVCGAKIDGIVVRDGA